MATDFEYNLSLSHSADDKAVVRPLAERSRQDGLQSLPQPSTPNHQPACAPLNRERRFIPLRLDDATGSRPSRSITGAVVVR